MTRESSAPEWSPLPFPFRPLRSSLSGVFCCPYAVAPPYRSDLRITSFSPDQTASTAHTFTSTKPTTAPPLGPHPPLCPSELSLTSSASSPTPYHPAQAHREVGQNGRTVRAARSRTHAPSRARPGRPSRLAVKKFHRTPFTRLGRARSGRELFRVSYSQTDP